MRNPKRPLLIVITFFVAIIAIIAGVFIYSRSSKTVPTPPPTETEGIVSKVGKHVVLPDENPTLGTITDLDKIKGQNFFIHAKLDDRVLIFPQAQRAVLYRPDTDRVIEIASVTINIASPSATPPLAPAPTSP